MKGTTFWSFLRVAYLASIIREEIQMVSIRRYRDIESIKNLLRIIEVEVILGLNIMREYSVKSARIFVEVCHDFVALEQIWGIRSSPMQGYKSFNIY